jgi:hypothetical protein
MARPCSSPPPFSSHWPILFYTSVNWCGLAQYPDYISKETSGKGYGIGRKIELFIKSNRKLRGARGSVVSWGTMLQARRSRVQVPMRSLDFFNWLNPPSRTMALGSTQSLTEMSTMN